MDKLPEFGAHNLFPPAMDLPWWRAAARRTIWIWTEEFEFLDVVDFGGAWFSVKFVIEALQLLFDKE